MPLAFGDDEIKERLATVLAYGDRKRLSVATGIHQTIVDDNFNAKEIRKSAAFTTLQIACALADIDEERGDRFMDEMRDMYEQSKIRRSVRLDTSHETARFVQSANQVASDRLAGEPAYAQLVDLRDAQRAGSRLHRALLDDVSDEKAGRLTPLSMENGHRKTENVRTILPSEIAAKAKRYRR